MAFGRKKPNHYEEKKPKKEERKVLSFEELPLEEYEKRDENVKIKLSKKKIIATVAVILVLVIAVLMYFGRGAIVSCVGVGEDEGISVRVSGSEVDPGNFALFSEGFCYASDTGFTYHSDKGEELYTFAHAYSDPMMRSKTNAAIVYDLGSVGYTITSDNKVVHTAEAQDNIYLADITADMSYALLTETSGYNARLEAYSPQHKLKFAYSFSEYYITAMALNNNASGAVVCGISADKGAAVSVIYVLDFTKEEPVAKHIISDDMIFDCDYLTSGSVCAVGSNGSYVCRGKGFSNLMETPYNQMTLTTYDINTDVGVLSLSLSRSGDGRNCTIECINSSGKSEASVETELQVLSVSTYKDRIAVTDTENVYLYKQSGDMYDSRVITPDARQVRMFGTKSVYVLGMGEIKIYKL